MSAESFGDEYDAVRDTEQVALDILRDYFDSPVLSTECGREGEVRDPETPSEALEFGHIDGIVHDEGVNYGLGLRTRPYHSDKRDISIRVKSRSGGDESELHDLRHSMNSDGLFPKFYFIGFTLTGFLREQTGKEFRDVFIVNTRAMLEAIDEGDVDYDGPIPSARDNPYDDSEAIYISLDELRDIGAVEYEFHEAEW